MGAVYLAANTRAFNRPCVVKEVIEYYDRYNAAEREKAMQRFESEARTLALLKNPGIPDIYAYFTEGGRNYLVMEYIEGHDLSEGLGDKPASGTLSKPVLPVEDLVRYATQICDVLIYLGQRQPPVIHNDIKPGNIILDESSGRAMLVDFGTAQSRYARPASDRLGHWRARAFGTAGYAAPELYEGKAEPRSDVYALAATVYHLLTRDDPRAHPFQFPNLDKVDEPLREALAAALEVDVGTRIDAEQFKLRLQKALEPQEAGTRRSKRARARQKPDRRQPKQKQATQQHTVKRQKTSRYLARRRRASIEIKPAQVALGRMRALDMYTDVRTLTVRNQGTTDARCRLEGMPAWLTVTPESWNCAPGQTQQVSLRGRATGLWIYQARITTTLRVIAEGHPHPYPVRVSMQPPASRRRRRRNLIKAAVVGAVSLSLAGLVTWFVLTVLSLL
jgi:serine/threonine protein kinase